MGSTLTIIIWGILLGAAQLAAGILVGRHLPFGRRKSDQSPMAPRELQTWTRRLHGLVNRRPSYRPPCCVSCDIIGIVAIGSALGLRAFPRIGGVRCEVDEPKYCPAPEAYRPATRCPHARLRRGRR